MAESKFNKRMRKELRVRGVETYRVESHGTEPGMPDNFWIAKWWDDPAEGDATTGWMEVKDEERLPTKVKYQPAQPAWLVSYSKLGGRCCTALHINSTDELILIPGSESLRASRNLSTAQCCERVNLREEGAWERVVDWLLE